MRRLNGVLGLLIGLFGALAILGVFFKIAKYPHYEILMAVGFFGEAAAFVVMGLFSLITGFTGRPAEGPEPTASAAAPLPGGAALSGAALEEALEEASEELRAELRALVRQGFAQNLEALGEVVRGDVALFGEEMRALGAEMQLARQSVHALRGEIEEVAAGGLPADAERLGLGMRQLAEGMAEAGEATERMREDLREMALRLSAFNDGRTSPHNGDLEGVVVSTPKGSRTTSPAEVAR